MWRFFQNEGAKSVNVKIAAPFFFCRKQEEMDAICAFTPAPEGIQGIHSKFRINRTFGSKMCECRIRRTFRGAKSVNMAIFSKPGSKKCECRKCAPLFFLKEKRGNACNMCIYAGSQGYLKDSRQSAF